MKNFQWKNLLKYHPLFSGLGEREVEQLLREEVSEERDCPQGSVILKEGEVGDSFFLIGSGSVQVAVPQNGHQTTLSVLRKGEFFGEMAVFEKRPRAATVTAKENCTLLEIKGQEFLKVVREHTNVALELLLKLSERLRHADEQVMAVKVKDVDEKLSSFNAKFDADLKVVDTMLGHTKKRADEIIESFERTRTWLTWLAALIIGIVTVGAAGGGLVTRWYYKLIEDSYTQAMSKAQLIDRLEQRMGDLERELIVDAFRGALKTEIPGDEVRYYDRLRSQLDPALKFFQPLVDIQGAIERNKPRRDYTNLLGLILKDAKDADRPTEAIGAYYLLLTNAILLKLERFPEGENFDTFLSAFEQYVRAHNRINKEDLPNLSGLFEEEDTEKQKMFQGVTKVIHLLKPMLSASHIPPH